MSDECKRLFSSAKLTIVNCHSRLKVDIIEVNIFEPSMEDLSWKIIVIVVIVRMMMMRLIANNIILSFFLLLPQPHSWRFCWSYQ